MYETPKKLENTIMNKCNRSRFCVQIDDENSGMVRANSRCKAVVYDIDRTDDIDYIYNTYL